MSRAARAIEWAQIAVQYHQRMQAKGQPIPFPEVCFCNGFAHKRNDVVGHDAAIACPALSAKTAALRMKALGEVLANG